MEGTPQSIIYDIFKEYFGEKNVDSPSFNKIIVRFPKVTITNENNNQIEIYDLFAIIDITLDGNFCSMAFTRSTFTKNQFYGGYIHSHVMPFGDYDNLRNGKSCCWGTGPIANTIDSLRKTTFNLTKDYYLWELFCVELTKYVKVESLSGGPFKTMSSINNQGNLKNKIQNILETNVISSYVPKCYEFINKYVVPYILKYKKLNIIYTNNYYSLNYSSAKAIEVFTDYFKDFVDLIYKEKIRGVTIEEAIDENDDDISIFINEGQPYDISLYQLMMVLYYSDGEYYLTKEKEHINLDIDNFKDKTIIKFKDKEYKFTIIDDKKQSITSNIMLKEIYVIQIINSINILLNKYD